jgi:predicted dehydrogenase
MSKYTVALAGCGVRGAEHMRGPLHHPDCTVVGLCDVRPEQTEKFLTKFNLDVPCYTDAEKMLAETRPDIFIFVTHPNVRVELVELGVKYGCKGITFEKPMALNLTDARYMAKLCSDNGVKASVCHQQKYMPSFQKLKGIVDSGELGKIKDIHVSCLPWMSQLGTHFMDYALWVSGGKKAIWGVGAASGREKLTDNHPSADYVSGTILLEDGIRLYFETGNLAEQGLPPEHFWCDNRLTVYGETGQAWAETDGRWYAASVSGGVRQGELGYFMSYPEMQDDFFKEFINWMDDDSKVHSCNIDTACHGFEVLEGLYLSALFNEKVSYPIEDISYGDINFLLKKML